MNAGPPLDKKRARQAASNVLATALQVRYRHFLATKGEGDENLKATAELAQAMYENIEFIIWALQFAGGRNPAPPEPLRPITPRPAANDMRTFATPPMLVIDSDAKAEAFADLADLTMQRTGVEGVKPSQFDPE